VKGQLDLEETNLQEKGERAIQEVPGAGALLLNAAAIMRRLLSVGVIPPIDEEATAPLPVHRYGLLCAP
jgi:hypothetical protein